MLGCCSDMYCVVARCCVAGAVLCRNHVNDVFVVLLSCMCVVLAMCGYLCCIVLCVLIVGCVCYVL